jgi:hypothetical protein
VVFAVSLVSKPRMMAFRISMTALFRGALFLAVIVRCGPLLATRQCPSSLIAALNPAHECVYLADEVDDEPIHWSPWTHKPECLVSETAEGLKYCLYTNSHNGFIGTSIITTPDVAANSAWMLDELDLSRLWTAKNLTASPPYKIADIPGKGKGVVATRLIRRSEVAMIDWASMLLDFQFPSSFRSSQGYGLFHQAMNQLRDPDGLLGLANRGPDAPDLVEDILRTNGFNYDFGGKPHMAVYALIAVESLPRYIRHCMIWLTAGSE